jgi:thymidylate synthase
MEQYLKLCNKIINEGKWVKNKRTGKRCLTIIDASLEYDVENNKFPLVTTRKCYWKPAIAELLGYLRGYDNASQFRALGCKTWDANANKTKAWLENPYRKGEDHLGRIYGVQGRKWSKPDGGYIDQLKKLIHNLSNGIDDRGEILSFYNPGEFHLGCLRPCMHTHTFSLLDNNLYLTSYQRSCDIPLGATFNQIQCFTLLSLIAQITNTQPIKCYHKIINAHIYEDQIKQMKNIQLKRKPYPSPKLNINPDIKTLKDIETWVTLDDFDVIGYQHHDVISYKFSE